MPKPTTEPRWVAEIYSILANGEGETDPEIAERLKSIESNGPAPAPRTIGKYKSLFREQPASVRQSYQELHFPGAMLEGLVPWEATKSCLELLAFCYWLGLPRPPIALAQMFWAVSRWGIGLSLIERVHMAVTIGSHTEAGVPLHDGFEGWLAFRSWGSDMKYYDEVIAREDPPLPRYEPRLSVAQGGPSGVWGARLLKLGLEEGALDDLVLDFRPQPRSGMVLLTSPAKVEHQWRGESSPVVQ
jgi:hypothetical protein